MRLTALRCLALVILLHAPVAGAQVIPVTIVELDRAVAGEVAVAFTVDHERLWCVTSWTTATRRGGYTLVTVTGVREETSVRVEASEVDLSSVTCTRPDGTAFPTLHSHPHGTCAAFPHDIEAYAARGAEFDGVLCAPTSSVWVTRWQMLAAIRMASDGIAMK